MCWICGVCGWHPQPIGGGGWGLNKSIVESEIQHQKQASSAHGSLTAAAWGPQSNFHQGACQNTQDVAKQVSILHQNKLASPPLHSPWVAAEVGEASGEGWSSPQQGLDLQSALGLLLLLQQVASAQA